MMHHWKQGSAQKRDTMECKDGNACILAHRRKPYDLATLALPQDKERCRHRIQNRVLKNMKPMIR
jgi:hypothetical protein